MSGGVSSITLTPHLIMDASAQTESNQPTYELLLLGITTIFLQCEMKDPELKIILSHLRCGESISLPESFVWRNTGLKDFGLKFLYTRLPDAPNATLPRASQDAITTSQQQKVPLTRSEGSLVGAPRTVGRLYVRNPLSPRKNETVNNVERADQGSLGTMRKQGTGPQAG